MPTSQIRALLFDKDGTLVDLQRTWGPASHVVLTRLSGGDTAVFARLAAAARLDPATQRLLPGSMVLSEPTSVYATSWAQALGRPATDAFFAEIDALFFEAVLQHLQLIGDPAAVLGVLAARGYRLGMMTNDADTNTRAQLRRLGLDHLFDFVAGYDSGHGAKPSPGPVLAFAAHANVAPAQIAVIGDTVHDLRAARAAGAQAVAVLSGPAGRDVLAPHADAVLDSIADLPRWLGPRGGDDAPARKQNLLAEMNAPIENSR